MLLITGACGKIGSYFASFAAGKYSLRLADKIPWDVEQHGRPPGQTHTLDLQNLTACRQACAGIDTVIHLAADADPEADFSTSLLPNNITGTHNIFLAAHEAGVKRLIYASSAHVVSGYPPGVQITSGMPVKPGNLYGVSKCYGEALAAYYASSKGMSCIVLRIGAYIFPHEYEHFNLEEADAFLDPDDFNQLLLRCIETANVHSQNGSYLIAHAISNNRHKRLDLTETKEKLGYTPQSDAFTLFDPPPPTTND